MIGQFSVVGGFLTILPNISEVNELNFFNTYSFLVLELAGQLRRLDKIPRGSYKPLVNRCFDYEVIFILVAREVLIYYGQNIKFLL